MTGAETAGGRQTDAQRGSKGSRGDGPAIANGVARSPETAQRYLLYLREPRPREGLRGAEMGQLTYDGRKTLRRGDDTRAGHGKLLGERGGRLGAGSPHSRGPAAGLGRPSLRWDS